MTRKKAKNVVFLLILLAAIAVTAVVFALQTSRTATAIRSDLTQRFLYLSQAHTNLCALPSYIYSLSDIFHLQGSCCSPMDFGSYVEQVGGLSNYSDISQIPTDPYNVSVSLAKELLGYDQNITLRPTQQAVYDQAVNMSAEHGPCCCRCWRWYAFEGQAKYFIVHKMFGAAQIAHIWELEDGCGGPLSSPGFNPSA